MVICDCKCVRWCCGECHRFSGVVVMVVGISWKCLVMEQVKINVVVKYILKNMTDIVITDITLSIESEHRRLTN